jgi:CubicO group peptidase (beta-lactamase class C family)
MRPLVALIVLSLFATSSRAQGAPDLPSAPKVKDAGALLDLWVREQIEYQEIPGVAVGVVHGDDLIWARSFGTSNLATNAPLTPRTPFRLGSVSKLFTASAILKLQEQGKLRLDDPVVKHLPWFRPQNPFAEVPLERITIEHLLTHTSGLPREGAFPYWTTHTFPSREDLQASIPTQQLFSPPGTAYRYSNLGVAVLGQVIEAVAKMPYAAFLKQAILDPLGMSSTTAAPDAATIAALAKGYQRKPSTGDRRRRPLMDYYETGTFAPMGGVVSTLEDMTRFLAFQLTADSKGPARSTDPARPLSPQTLAEMHRVRFVYPSFTGGRGLGFAISRRDERNYVTHAGWIGGHRADLIVDPARRLAVVALTNADDANPALFSRKALDLFGAAIDATVAAPIKAKVADPSWSRYFGRYTDPWGWEYEALVLDGGLVLYEHNYPPEEEPGDGVNALTPAPDAGPNAFRMGDGELVVFEMENGRVKRVRRRYEYLTPVIVQ